MYWYTPEALCRSPRSRRSAFCRAIFLRASAFAALAMGANPQAVWAQADRIDAGSFTVLKAGERIGREQFSIRKAPNPEGAAYELRAESTRGDRRIAVQLTTDSSGTPLRYAVEVRDDANVTVRLGGQRVRGRFAVLSRRPNGETAREYLLPPGSLIVEAELFHQLYLVVKGRGASQGEAFSVQTLSPLSDTQSAVRVLLESLTDSVTIAGVSKPARRWRMEGASGAGPTFWADADGRIMRVRLANNEIEAIRDDIPHP
jgi:hypothetical protein